MSVTSSFTASSSWSAETITVCAVFQFAVVKVRLAVLSDRSVPACPVMVTVTVSVGSDESRMEWLLLPPSATVNVASPSVPPPSWNVFVPSSFVVTGRLLVNPA